MRGSAGFPGGEQPKRVVTTAFPFTRYYGRIGETLTNNRRIFFGQAGVPGATATGTDKTVGGIEATAAWGHAAYNESVAVVCRPGARTGRRGTVNLGMHRLPGVDGVEACSPRRLCPE